MSESELHAILNEIKNKGQVPNADGAIENRTDCIRIIEAFSPVTTADAISAFSAARNDDRSEAPKKSLFDKIKSLFKK